MKIITWNCNMAFRKKAAYVLAHNPDIVIIPECEHPDKLTFTENTPLPTDWLWMGDNKNKGLGIFSYSHFTFKLLRNHNPKLKTIIPISVTGNDVKFTLFAIWANNPTDPDGQYVEQICKALAHYKRQLKATQTILMGDFNSNTIWDKKFRIGNHSHVVEQLEKKGIHSCYHTHYKQEQGKEKDPTFYLYKHKEKSYHLDYCFASTDMIDKIQSVEIGAYDFWKPYSDHVPVMVTFN